MFTFLSRTAKYAVKDFYRNFWLSVITITVVIIAIFTLNSLLLIKTISEYTLQTIEKKIDVSVFINPSIEESVILDLRDRLLALDEVTNVIYVSADEALQSMISRHGNDQDILQSIQQIEQNPLGAELIVQANNTADYPQILELLSQDRFKAVISDQDFEQHTIIISSVSSISDKVRTFATVMSIVFSLIALIVVFNTIRVIIYTHREEIAIMKLVGATNFFIRMPYLWQVVIYSLVAMAIFILLWYPLIGFIEPYVNELFSDATQISLIGYYNTNFVSIFGSQTLVLIGILVVASFFATRKYSRV